MIIYAVSCMFLGILRSFGGSWVMPRLCLPWGFHHYPAIVGGLFWSVSFFATGQLAGLASLFTCSPSTLYGLPWSSGGKKSACNAEDPGSIPGWGRSTGELIDSPLQCTWTSLVVQLVNNSPEMQETWVQYLGWDDPLEKGTATHSSILAWIIPWTV